VSGLHIAGNPNLTSVSGMSGASSPPGQEFNVFQNARLPRCGIAALAARMGTECGCPGDEPPAACVPGCVFTRFMSCVPCDWIGYCNCGADCTCVGNDNTQLLCPP
jgi:hypothetical protein